MTLWFPEKTRFPLQNNCMSAAPLFPWIPESSESGLDRLFQHAPLGFAQCTPQGSVVAMNPALERILGGSLASLASSRFGDLVRSTDRSDSQRLFQQIVNGERESFQVDNQVPGTDGRVVWVRWTVWRVPGSGGKPDSGVLLAEETTDHRHLEQRLHQAQRLEAVGRLAGGVAHDFNNLLTGVLLYSDLLLAGMDPGDRQRKYAEEVRGAVLQATGLVRQLLAVARPQLADPQLLSLNDVAAEMRSLLGRLIGENIELQLHLDPTLGLVRMDPTQAQQILLNLVLNARDAMPDGGRILVETSNCQIQVLAPPRSAEVGCPVLPCALLVVGDNGKGMDAETRKHLFEAFFTTKAAGQGTGLGLSTVHQIVNGSGGLIHVDSEPGGGTRITILLPLVPEAFAAVAGAPDLKRND
jgi:two-component system cell cycle sensor histidine kinase/response regulator CckA